MTGSTDKATAASYDPTTPQDDDLGKPGDPGKQADPRDLGVPAHAEMVANVWMVLVDEGDTVVSNPVSAQQRPSVVQIEAAKLRLVTDRRLGKKSPEWLLRVAQGLPARPEDAAAGAGPSTG